MTAATRDRMIESTSRLVMRQGFHATSLSDILKEAEAPRGSFYFHFPGGKEELFVAATRAAVDMITEIRRTSFESAADFNGGIHAWFDAMLEMVRNEDYYLGCPVTALTSDAVEAGSPLQEVCQKGLADWEQVYADHMVIAGLPSERAPGLATFFLAAEEGALIMARSRRAFWPLEQVRDRLITVLHNELAA